MECLWIARCRYEGGVMDSFPLILEKRYASVQFPQIR